MGITLVLFTEHFGLSFLGLTNQFLWDTYRLCVNLQFSDILLDDQSVRKLRFQFTSVRKKQENHLKTSQRCTIFSKISEKLFTNSKYLLFWDLLFLPFLSLEIIQSEDKNLIQNDFPIQRHFAYKLLLLYISFTWNIALEIPRKLTSET